MFGRMGLGFGAMGGTSGRPPYTVQAFAYEAETTTLAASFGTPPTTARKRTINRCIKRLKACGAFAKATGLYFVGLDEDASLKNWKTPGTADLVKNGAPTFVANSHWVAAANGDFLDTQIVANTLSLNDHSVFVWSQSTGSSDNADIGAVVTGVGTSVCSRNSTGSKTSAYIIRSGTNVNSACVNSNYSDGFGCNGYFRNNSANFTAVRNGIQQLTPAVASVSLPAYPIYLLSLNNAGTPSASFSTRQIAFAFVGAALTVAQAREMTGAIGEYLAAIKYGEPVIEEPGIGPATVTADCVFYGLTGQSICGALQAARAGASVAICGGWRDRHFGGMSGGGLGFTDFDTHASLGGLPRYIITRMNAMAGVADTQFYFEPRRFQWVMRELLNPALNGGFTIPIYWSRGVISVAKTGAVVTSFTTADGRKFNLRQWFDGSYEGDLMRAAGVGYTYGREAAGSGAEANNGVQLSSTDQKYQPWVTTNTPTSGLIPGVQGVRSTFTPALDTVGADGTADSHTQAYNFRLTATNSTYRAVPFPSTPPSDYNVANYEFLLRFLAGNPPADTFAEVLKTDSVDVNDPTYDVNNLNFVSSDYVGHSDSYALASYATRETIWKAHWNYILGFMYTIQYGTDIRIAAGLKTDALLWSLVQDHNYTVHENDLVFEMPQMYIREGIRMVGAAVYDGTDIAKVDGTAPRISTNTIATISYQMDSHAIQRVAHETSAGVWTTKSEGGLAVTAGGVDKTAPVPIEVVVPKVAECSNGAVGFCVSATHVAFGAIRMEYTAMQIGQSMGHAMALASAGDNIIQNVVYATLRTALLASHPLSGEVAPVLPQVN